MIDEELKKQILADYKRNRPTYKSLVYKLEQLLRDLLKTHGIIVHSVSGRAKKRKSLADKLTKKNSNYQNLANLTDLAGIRIITYFADDVDRVAAIVEAEFDIDTENSIDKRASLAVDRFGYLSRHHVFSLKDSRCELVEYRIFKGLKAELQTRSILQHAWAEIEHDLGYKSTIEVPPDFRRRFALVAGQLESVDNEFNRIKIELDKYRTELLTSIQTSPLSIPLSLDSARALVVDNEDIANMDSEISKVANVRVSTDNHQISTKNDSELSSLYRYGMTTVGDVLTGIQKYKEIILILARILFSKYPVDTEHGILEKGICIYYLSMIVSYVNNFDYFEIRMTQMKISKEDAQYLWSKIESVNSGAPLQ